MLVVEKTTNEHSHIGVFTNHDYGKTKSYSYKLKIDNINWNGESGEPKNILFCDGATYLYSYQEKSINNNSLRKMDSTIAYESYDTVVEVYQKHIDERYFFSQLGSEYWVTVLAKEYTSKKKTCNEYSVPNDGELTLGKD